MGNLQMRMPGRVPQPSMIVDPAGKPMMAAAYDAAERYSRELSSWQPTLRSPDAELLPEWETLVSRQRDMIRNHGLASGAVQTHLDNVISTGLRCIPKPDWRALGQSVDWAEEWEQIVKARWRQFADDVDCYIDVGRRLTFDGLLAQMYRSYLTSTEIVSTLEWMPRHPDHSATCVNVIQPDMLSNPDNAADTWSQRGGVRLHPQTREPLGYWFRQVHASESATIDAPAFKWRYVPAYTKWGRRQVIHIFDAEGPGQTRGKPSFASVLSKMRMLDKFEKTTLQAAIVNAMYAAVIESSLDHAQVATALGVGDESSLEAYMGAQAVFHEKGTVFADGVKIPHLVPGENLKFMTPGNPSPAFDQFEQATLRHLAAGLNLSYEQLSRDYSRTNYSSARASALEAWKFFMGRRHFVGGRAASMIYVAWMEEEIDRGLIPLPAGAPDFYSAKTAYTRCLWIGAPRGHIDEEKEMKAREIKYRLGMVTHEAMCAEEGVDSDEVIEQLAREKIKFDKAGLPMPGTKPAQAESPATQTPDDASTQRAVQIVNNMPPVTVHAAPAPDVHVHNAAPEAPVVNVQTPEVRVEPVINVQPPAVRVEAPVVNVAPAQVNLPDRLRVETVPSDEERALVEALSK